MRGDDFVMKNGTTLNVSAENEDQVYPFGKSCKSVFLANKNILEIHVCHCLCTSCNNQKVIKFTKTNQKLRL